MGKMIILNHPEEKSIIRYYPGDFIDFYRSYKGHLVIKYTNIARITGGFCFYVEQPPVYTHMQLYDKDCKMLNYDKYFNKKEGETHDQRRN